MIKRSTPFSDIVINKFQVHRVILYEKTSLFENITSDITVDKRLDLPFDDDVVDKFLDVVYNNLDIEYSADLFKVFEYTGLKNVPICAILKKESFIVINQILSEFPNIEYSIQFNKPTNEDYKYLCCLPHGRYYELLSNIMDEVTKSKINDKFNMNQLQIYYITNYLRCILGQFTNYEWIYTACSYFLMNNKYTKEYLVSGNASLFHDKSPRSAYARADDNITEKSTKLTKKCTKILKELGWNCNE